MSKYTTEVRYICEVEAGKHSSEGFNSINTIIQTAAPHVFNFDFPIFDENYRLPLEVKILRHYYTREIGEETVGLWKLRLQDRLNMIMPYYNKLYQSELLEFNPLYDVDLTREHDRNIEGSESRAGNNTETTSSNGSIARTQVTDTDTSTVTDTDTTNVIDTDTTNTNTNVGSSESDTTYAEDGSTTNDNVHWDLYSDTPQGGINGITNDSDSVANNTYLTNARKITDDGEGTHELESTTHNEQSSTITDNGSGTVDTSETGTVDTTVTGTVDTTVTDNTSTTNSGSRTNATTDYTTLTNTEDYIEHVSGKQGGASYSKMLMEFRETFLNIDKRIIDDLSDLFFGLW